ncbi:unnamed protein product [Aureobasidium mustum]|uniref:Uncharacterized protein n=1 Tax=Aureobasidium mustum TaxID=2773714 RepID=A0A9N8PBK2_9PEZI|nr:unnamed protein product [Aureobasidium mustum]
MSSPKQSSAEKKGKVRETCRRGPEDGFPFITQRVTKPLEEPVVVRRGPRPAGPHRAIKKVAAESERNAVPVGDTTERNTSKQVAATQTSAKNPPAVSASDSKSSSLVSDSARGQHHTKDNSRMIKPAGEPETLSTTMPGYADSDDGGVGLPQHITTKNDRDTARSVATQITSDSTGFASGTPENVPKHDGGQLSAAADNMGARGVTDEGDELARIFAKLDALNRSRRGR